MPQFILTLAAALLLTPAAHAAETSGFAPADSFRTLSEVRPGKKAGEKSITLRWAPVNCVNGYAVHLSLREDMTPSRVAHTGKQSLFIFPTRAAGTLYWQVGCKGGQSADDAGVATQTLAVRKSYLPMVVPTALTKRVVRKDGAGDSLPLAGVNPAYRHRLEVYSPRLEPLSARESAGDDAFWPSLAPGVYYYRVQSLNESGEETYPTPLAVLQVLPGAGESPARDSVSAGAGRGLRGIRLAVGPALVGQTGTQNGQAAKGDLSAGVTLAGHLRFQWNWNPRWAVDLRALFFGASYTDSGNLYPSTKFTSGEYRAVVQRYFAGGNKFWFVGAGLGSRNHPFVLVQRNALFINTFQPNLVGARTTDLVLRGGVEWRSARWQHTVILDLMGPLAYKVNVSENVKGSFSPNGEIELTSYYTLNPRFSVGGFLAGRLAGAKLSYPLNQTSEEVTLKFSRVTGGALASYLF